MRAFTYARMIAASFCYIIGAICIIPSILLAVLGGWIEGQQ
jgi:hypothetical protein